VSRFTEQELVPFPRTMADEPQVTHCRGTLIFSSRQTLQRHGHFDAYRRHLAPEHELAIASSTAGSWLPIELAVAHYRTCDALGLPVDEQLRLGGAVVHDIQRTFIGSVLRAAVRGAAVSPLVGMQKFFGTYARSFRGGGSRMVQIGPKDLRVEFVGNPVAAVHYFRVAFRGFITAGAEVFAHRVVTAELEAYGSPTSVAYRLAWV
jgi:hypothetical protein